MEVGRSFILKIVLTRIIIAESSFIGIKNVVPTVRYRKKPVMERLKILLGNIDSAVKFVSIMDSFETEALIVGDGKAVNPKSILGVLSLDLNRNILLEIDDSDPASGILRNRIKEYIVD